MLAIPQENQKHIVQPSPMIGEAPGNGEEEARLLLRFAAPRDPALIAKWISYQVFNTERQDWRRGAEAARRYREREQDLEVPYDHVEGAYPLGRWLSDQRRAFRTGSMSGERAAELEQLGIVWDTADQGFAENLAAARAYYQLHGTLCAPRHATMLDRAVGQWLTNIRRPEGLGKDPVRARRRTEELVAIDRDWNPGEKGWTRWTGSGTTPTSPSSSRRARGCPPSSPASPDTARTSDAGSPPNDATSTNSTRDNGPGSPNWA